MEGDDRIFGGRIPRSKLLLVFVFFLAQFYSSVHPDIFQHPVCLLIIKHFPFFLYLLFLVFIFLFLVRSYCSVHPDIFKHPVCLLMTKLFSFLPILLFLVFVLFFSLQFCFSLYSDIFTPTNCIFMTKLFLFLPLFLFLVSAFLCCPGLFFSLSRYLLPVCILMTKQFPLLLFVFVFLFFLVQSYSLPHPDIFKPTACIIMTKRLFLSLLPLLPSFSLASSPSSLSSLYSLTRRLLQTTRGASVVFLRGGKESRPLQRASIFQRMCYFPGVVASIAAPARQDG